MADSIDFFWQIFEAVSGGTGVGITDALNALAKSDRAKIENYFTEVIDQVSFTTEDYIRFRKFLVDLFATHRTLASQSIAASDPHSLSNSDLDELFRSFGYPYSSQLRGFDANPLEQKIQFFLDLVNLYKVKGTPQSLIDVLQYYGVTEIDIYEFILKLDSIDTLVFDGKPVAGTSIAPNRLKIPYENLTSTDPHWLYTAQQIIQLNQTNKINLPSQSPYLGIQPIVDLDGIEFSIISRHIQDQYNYWLVNDIVPPPNDEITFIGEIKSLLELYLSIIYMFNKEFETGKEQDPCNFLCYDGTSTTPIEIINEFNSLSAPPIRRCDLNSNVPPFPTLIDPNIIISKSYCSNAKLPQYIDAFTRPSSTNFLIDRNSAGDILNIINPVLKGQLDAVGEPIKVLYSLLKDLSNWVRNNIGYGFINFGFILFGINEFFKDLKPVIEFFKPYRARLLLLESLQIKNRLFNTVVVEDSNALNIDIEIYNHDYITGNGTPCSIDEEITKCQREIVVDSTSVINLTGLWKPDTDYYINDVVVSGLIPGSQFICTQNHKSNSNTTKPGYGSDWSLVWNLYSEMVCSDTTGINTSVYSRETFDCGSYFDIGAVTDIPKDIFIEIEQTTNDHFRCPSDGSAFIVSEITSSIYSQTNTTNIRYGVISENIIFENHSLNTNYSIAASLRNLTGLGSAYNFIITEKSTSGFVVNFSGVIDSQNYWLDWYLYDTTNAGITSLVMNDQEKIIILNQPCDSTNYVISAILKNVVDSNPSIYSWVIVNQTTTSFTIKFSGIIDSNNYELEWSICEGLYKDNHILPAGISQITIPLPESIVSAYPLLISLLADTSNASIYTPLIIDKTETHIKIQFSGIIDSEANYSLSWIIPSTSTALYDWFRYYQTSGFRDFDSDATFDCTHGFDFVDITVEDVSNYLLQETGFKLFQENGSGILL